LRAELRKAITAPDVVERFEKAGGRPMAVMGDEAKALQKRDIDRWVPLIKAAGIQPE
jgi:tripartite-type tricarboxylate transporter receptor subunit TctC